MKARVKMRLAILLASCAVLNGLAQESVAATPISQDPICGFIAGPHYSCEADQIKQGLSTDLFIGDTQVGKPVRLRFFVNQKPKGFPVDGLQVEHEKFIHVIGVRDDLKQFFHVHPARVSPGMWEVTHTFTEGGNYKLWSDMKYRGIAYTFGHPLLTGSGTIGRTEKNHDFTNFQVVAGYQVTLSHPEPLIAGKTNQLQFVIRDAAGSPIETENFLGASMHLVIVSDDLSVYLHGHPESRSAGDRTIRFNQIFAKPCACKLFAQFRPGNSKLPVDSAILAEFYVNVAASGSASVDAVASEAAIGPSASGREGHARSAF